LRILFCQKDLGGLRGEPILKKRREGRGEEEGETASRISTRKEVAR
jgi:hypothetical protein